MKTNTNAAILESRRALEMSPICQDNINMILEYLRPNYKECFNKVIHQIKIFRLNYTLKTFSGYDPKSLCIYDYIDILNSLKPALIFFPWLALGYEDIPDHIYNYYTDEHGYIKLEYDEDEQRARGL